MTDNPKGMTDRTLAALQLGTDSAKILALLRTYTREEVIEVLPHFASTGFLGEQFAGIRAAIQAQLDADLLKEHISALQRVNSEQIAALTSLHQSQMAETRRVSAVEVEAVNRLNRSTTVLSVIAIVCTVALGLVSLASSCGGHR